MIFFALQLALSMVECQQRCQTPQSEESVSDTALNR